MWPISGSEYQSERCLFVFSDRGVCGEVKLAIEKETCKKVALKTINKHDFPSIGVRTSCIHLTVMASEHLVLVYMYSAFHNRVNSTRGPRLKFC